MVTTDAKLASHMYITPTCVLLWLLVMSIGNQKFGLPRKYQYQIGIWYFCPNFFGIFLVFYRYFEKALVKIWLNIGILAE